MFEKLTLVVSLLEQTHQILIEKLSEVIPLMFDFSTVQKTAAAVTYQEYCLLKQLWISMAGMGKS